MTGEMRDRCTMRSPLPFCSACFIVSVPRSANFTIQFKYPSRRSCLSEGHEIHGRVFHNWVWGGYLIWHIPEFKVFIDGRGRSLRSNGVFKDYVRPIPSRIRKRCSTSIKVEYVLMPADSLLSRFLKISPTWTLLYSDEAQRPVSSISNAVKQKRVG